MDTERRSAMIVYVKTQGARIIREGRHLLVKKGDAVYHTLFTYKLDQLLLFGNIEITHPALCQLMRNNIDIVFLTQNGRYLGRMAPVESKNVFLHKRQYLLLDHLKFNVTVARSIVSGELSNMATLLMRIKRSKNRTEAGQQAKKITGLLPKLSQCDDLDSIRGYEGMGSALFFQGFREGFKNNLGFTKRVRRPPTDPVNSVLSLLYTFLMNRVYSAVRISGLNPYPGVLHAIDYGRYSLVLDLMEQFRTIIADTLTLSLFNLQILQEKDFHIEKSLENSKPEENTPNMPDVSQDPIGMISGNEDEIKCFDMPEQRMEPENKIAEEKTGKYPVKLNSDAFARIIEAFEKKLTTRFFYPLAERNMTYGDAIIFQTHLFRKVIEGEVEVYQPLLMK
jgi:CRISPR-associated protein Cas1